MDVVDAAEEADAALSLALDGPVLLSIGATLLLPLPAGLMAFSSVVKLMY